MPISSQPYRLVSGSWADTFPSSAGSLHELFGEQSWQPEQNQSDVQSRLVDGPPYEFDLELSAFESRRDDAPARSGRRLARRNDDG
jgi:hypothetical protein